MSKIAKLIFCSLIFFAFLIVVLKENSNVKKAEQENFRIILRNAYQTSYDRGYREFLKQFMENEPGAAYQYTSQVQEKPVSEQIKNMPEYQDVINRGYEDGYHRASELSNCPM